MRTGVQMRPDAVQRPSVNRDERRFWQGPAHAGRRQAERGRRGDDPCFIGGDMCGERRADAMEERIARRQNADLSSAHADNLAGCEREWRGPRLCLALDERRGKLKMAQAAEHDLRIRD